MSNLSMNKKDNMFVKDIFIKIFSVTRFMHINKMTIWYYRKRDYFLSYAKSINIKITFEKT